MAAVADGLTELMLPNPSQVSLNTQNAVKADSFNDIATLFVLDSLGHECLRSTEYVIDNFLNELSSTLSLTTKGHYFSLMVDSKLLCQKFNYFRTMFDIDMRESQQRNKVELQDIQLIDFLHIYVHNADSEKRVCGFCQYNDDLMTFRLIDTCVYLQADDVYENSMIRLLHCMSSTNCLGSMVCAFKYSHEMLFSKALQFSLFYCKELFRQRCKLEKHLLSYCSGIEDFYLTHPMLNRDAACEAGAELHKSMLQVFSSFPLVCTTIPH